MRERKYNLIKKGFSKIPNLDKTNWESVELPKEDYVEVVQNKHSGTYYGCLWDNNGIYIFKGRNKKEFEEDIIKVLSKENKSLLTRIEKKGFDKVINYFYPTLQNKSGGKK